MKISSSTELSMLLVSTFLLTTKPFSEAIDTITASQNITDGQTLISSDGTYELGFFSPRNSNNRYVGIWYKKIAAFTVAWVANRDNPIKNSSGAVLMLNGAGNKLVLVDGNNSVVWFTNHTTQTAKSAVAKLLESGNLVIKEADDDSPENYLWQSFDYPTDTLLPGMKLGKNLITGREYYLSSWKSVDDPGTGDYTYHLDPTGYPQTILKRDSVELYRIGPWNGVGYSGLPALQPVSAYTFDVVMDYERGVYYSYTIPNNSVVSRFVMNYTGVGQRWMWVERSRDWILYLTAPVDNCDSYQQCGAYGICNLGLTPICGCLDDKFVPKHPDEWAGNDWSSGCVRRTGLNCSTDWFLKYSNMKLPDVSKGSWHNASMNLEECRDMCSRNCSCTAYTNLDVRRGGSGCLLWFGDLVDMKRVYGSTQDIYIRLASSEFDSRKSNDKLILSLTLSLGLILLVLCLMFCIFKRKKLLVILRKGGWFNKPRDKDLELPLFELSKISKATNNFSFQNKLGEGGYGPVFMGTLDDGQEIAVKRLSKSSLQGLDEFKNEVLFIVKLQHRNLVKLLGCCIHGEENMLVYEYMPNKSLDLILFDSTKSKLLDWPKRFQIIKGIARGLMYLHEDSRLRIIHRDLKTSNILLDSDMNPKISDFGLARSFRGNEIEAKTSRVVGTYGYMPPEYAIDGMFSIKSDVFSFGVIVLEILSGQKNRGFTHMNHHHNLLGHTWLLYREGNSMEMLDQNITYETSNLWQVMKAIHVGLLCVQKSTDDRPNMSSVVFMLENDIVLPEIKQPGFFMERDFWANDNSTSTQTKTPTSNEITMSLPEGR